ncbi:MAG: hypothetical protein OXG81_07105 [Acidobacteria bacterium]|nr:hypothetical protein [Acidobacteriota bacterium]
MPCCSWDEPAALSCRPHVEKSATPGWFSGCADLLVRTRRDDAKRRARVAGPT